MLSKGIIFDLDGTLIDSLTVTVRAFDIALKSFGGSLPGSSAEFLSHSGTPLHEVCRKMALPESFAARYLVETKRLRNTILMYPGTLELLNDLMSQNYTMAILTGKDRESTSGILNNLDLGKFFQVVITPDDGHSAKPSPDPANWISKELGIETQDCTMIGDSPLDIECGTNAGMYTIGCTWGIASETQLNDVGANCIVHKVSDLHRQLFT